MKKHLFSISKLWYDLPETAKQVLCVLLGIFIFVSCYYISMYSYNFSNDNNELISVCTTSFEESKPVSQPNTWYKNIIDDFFNKFTSKSKTINPEFMKIKSDNIFRTLIPLEHNLKIAKKSVILNKIQDDWIDNLITECEFTKLSYKELVKDICDIVQEMNDSSKKS
jgi:hypothetical protein